MSRFSFTLAALAVLARAAFAADATAVTVDGREFEGNFAGLQGDKLLLSQDGAEHKIPLNQLTHLRFGVQERPAASPAKTGDAAQGPQYPQAKDPEILKLQSENPQPKNGEANLVYLRDAVYELKDDMSSTMSERTVQKIYSDRARDDSSSGKFYYIDGYQSGRLDYACALNGKTASCADDTTIQDGAEFADFPGYDYLRSVKFSVPNAGPGTIVDYRYTVNSESHYKSFPFSGTFQFADEFAPVRAARITVIVPDRIKINAALANAGGAVQAQVREADGKRVYTWTAQNISPLASEEDMPPAPRIAPTLTFSTEDSWQSVASFFGAQLEKKLAEPSPLDAVAKNALDMQLSQLDRAKVLYGWVMHNMTYQPVEPGVSSYIPTQLSRIQALSAGNAVDKPFTLYALLRNAGLAVSFVYLESYYGAPFAASVPSIKQFAAAAVLLHVDGQDIMLCPYEDWIRFGYIPSYLQGMTALAVHGDARAPGLFTAPVLPPRAEAENLSAKMLLTPQGDVSVLATINPSGSFEEMWRSYRGLSADDAQRQIATLVHGIHPKARLVDYRISSLDDITAPPEIRLQYSIRNFGVKSSDGQYMAVRMPGVERPAGDVSQSARRYPASFGRCELGGYTLSFDVPNGYEVYSLPQPVKEEEGPFTYNAAYRQDGATITFAENFERRAQTVEPKDYPAYRKLRMDMAKFTDNWVVLRRLPDPEPAPPAAPPATPAPPPAAQQTPVQPAAAQTSTQPAAAVPVAAGPLAAQPVTEQNTPAQKEDKHDGTKQ